MREVYLDNAATSLKPKSVLLSLLDYYENNCANVHRGDYRSAEKATALYEGARVKVQNFLSASSHKEIIFTSGSTEALNLVASSYGEKLGSQDEVIITRMEHHSNIVPWQMLKERTGIKLKVIELDSNGTIELETFKKLLSNKVKLVSVSYSSNTLGIKNPVKEIIRLSHQVGAKVMIDAAQGAQHDRLDVKEMDADFLCISGHKIFGPTGIGALYGKLPLLNSMNPYKGGGEMILDVQMDSSIYKDAPHRFEAGTPPIAQAIAMGAAIDFIEMVGLDYIQKREEVLLKRAKSALDAIEGVRVLGNVENKAPVFSFLIEGIHSHDTGTLLNEMGVSIRTGKHCTHPLLDHFGVSSAARASFSFYNTLEDVDRLEEAIKFAMEKFS